MSSLHGARASFDPLSAGGDDHEDAFTTVFESGPHPSNTAVTSDAIASDPQPLGSTQPAPAAAATTTAAPSEYDSFMTAHSGNMSYMTSSLASTAAAAGPTSNPFRRLPDRPSLASGGGGGGGGYAQDSGDGAPPPFPPPAEAAAAAAPQTTSAFSKTSNPFAAASAAMTSSPPQQRQEHTYGSGGGAVDLGPLSFGDDGGGGAPNTAFSMPLDLYDTPDAFAGPLASPAAAAAVPPPPYGSPYPSLGPSAAAAAPAQKQTQPALPPLYDFTREFSTAPLPVSEDPTSSGRLPSAGVSAGWYDNAAAAAAGSTAAAAPGGGSGGAGPSSGAAAARASTSGASGSGGGGFVSYSAAALLSNTVTVHSPRKAVGPSRIPGLSEPYIVYVVTSRGAVSSETSVERRFRDVVALGEMLGALYPGCFLPPRPSRNAIEGRRMQPGFVEERRAGMEKFLRRLVGHPVLGPCEATQVWLRAPTCDLRGWPQWAQLRPAPPPGLARSTARLLAQVVGREAVVPRDPREVTRPASEAGDVYRLVHERAAQMRGVLGRVQSSPSEERLRQETATLQERSEALLSLSRKADHLVARAAKVAAVHGDLAAALTALAEADSAAAAAVCTTSAAALHAAADGCGKANKLYGIATDASAKHLTPLHDWLAAAPGASTALAAREGCLLTLATLEADEAAARRRLAEAEAKYGSGGGTAAAAAAAARKVEGARHQVLQLAAAVAAAREEYERVGQRNTSELEDFKAHMSRELADAVREFTVVQLAVAQKAHAVWQEAAAALVTLAASAAAVPPPPGLGGAGAGGSSGAYVDRTAAAGMAAAGY